MVTTYNVISADGYIADKNGNEDFIPDVLWPQTLEFFMKYDALVIGRKTYDAIQKYPKAILEAFEKLPIKKVVVTENRSFCANPEHNYVILHSASDIRTQGKNVLVTSGPILNTYLLENGLIDKIVFHKLPNAIGDGIRPFDTDLKNILVPVEYV